MQDINYEVEQEFGVISESKNGWTKEVNLVKFNDMAPKYDIRDWNPDKTKMSKGIRLTEDELVRLRDILNEILGE
ncbi:MAG: hypothetical protein CSB16_01175 [Clostridiales bacterium]|nr:MAG: hypothetical protein CSB16_01175 [Clostridiales bacterium]